MLGAARATGRDDVLDLDPVAASTTQLAWESLQSVTSFARCASAFPRVGGAGRKRRFAAEVLARLDENFKPERSAAAVEIAEFRMTVPRTVFSPIRSPPSRLTSR